MAYGQIMMNTLQEYGKVQLEGLVIGEIAVILINVIYINSFQFIKFTNP